MKLSISLSPIAGNALHDLVRAHNSNPSAICETALRLFERLSNAKRESAVRETHDAKKIPSATQWRETFWRLLADEFDAENNVMNTMGPRTYDGLAVVFLLSDVRNSRSDAIIVHVMDPIAHGPADYRGYTQEYAAIDSVYQAARDIANWIKSEAARNRTNNLA